MAALLLDRILMIQKQIAKIGQIHFLVGMLGQMLPVSGRLQMGYSLLLLQVSRPDQKQILLLPDLMLGQTRRRLQVMMLCQRLTRFLETNSDQMLSLVP